ncbi:hypothetical protein QNH14_01980 [Apirhabdus apintestini]|nr:hypothetical protein QNH14_01980 [Enterobacteriaceae bacterium CA-0114]
MIIIFSISTPPACATRRLSRQCRETIAECAPKTRATAYCLAGLS